MRKIILIMFFGIITSSIFAITAPNFTSFYPYAKVIYALDQIDQGYIEMRIPNTKKVILRMLDHRVKTWNPGNNSLEIEYFTFLSPETNSTMIEPEYEVYYKTVMTKYNRKPVANVCFTLADDGIVNFSHEIITSDPNEIQLFNKCIAQYNDTTYDQPNDSYLAYFLLNESIHEYTLNHFLVTEKEYTAQINGKHIKLIAFQKKIDGTSPDFNIRIPLNLSDNNELTLNEIYSLIDQGFMSQKYSLELDSTDQPVIKDRYRYITNGYPSYDICAFRPWFRLILSKLAYKALENKILGFTPFLVSGTILKLPEDQNIFILVDN